MSALIDALRRNPVRRWLYSVMFCAVALLVTYGIIDALAAPVWLALGAAVLGVPVIERVHYLTKDKTE